MGEHLPNFGCADGSCPFYSRLGMHTNGGCRCVAGAFPDFEQQRIVDAMLRKAREVATLDAETLGQRRMDRVDRFIRINELKAQLGDQTDREIIEERKRLRAEIRKIEEEGYR